ncbi:DNA-binding transcriptional LysR family regulator [Delftia sp. 60]|uniref:LysR family transcriptional regulator n=1 Tax=Delftia TaxID=80865 RepID=UPI000B492118|nr:MULTISPECIES: LysR family transcriptional regulator [Delftia]PIF35490.1 DNA-binding transcriptional LysR family regulator [Burkholderiales bacterium 23]ATH12871.1 LysR family transcriptional regulator [Delftia acidovorans]MBJ2141475.1 LysR family transcriptional regulator [Delftia acidovorans]OWG13254.1 LysR family transcriptional regulator [Delftia sp. K82]PIF63728.1 DNA-binding transcriptional LysR family regulator [Delftia sp. 60]
MADFSMDSTPGRPARDGRARAALGQLGDMDLRLLRVFKAVVECGGMSAAELELNIGSSTLSRHMKDLEERLGLTLCRRGRAGFALTPEGHRIYEATLQLLGGVEGFLGQVDDIHGRLAGTLDVALFDKTVGNPQSRIPEAIGVLHDQAPQLHLRLHVASIQAIERGLMEGRWQVGVLPSAPSSGALDSARLFGERMQLYCAPGHPLHGADHGGLDWDSLGAHAFAGLGYQSPNMALSHQAGLQRQATGFDQEAIAMLVRSGRYLGFLPDHYAQAMQDQGLLQAVAPHRFFYLCDFFAVWRNAVAPGRAARVFIDALLAVHHG